MGKRLLLMVFFAGMTFIGFAQNENKFSASTLMFLSEQLGETELPKLNEKQEISMLSTLPGGTELDLEELGNKRFRTRPIAAAEMVNGVKMISAFIGVKDNDFSGLESLGVILEAKFDNLATALIPVSNIEKVAALENVTRIEVAEILQPYNDQQRAVTRAYDAITNSDAAQALGITSPYTGKGVILGIIDTGIDFQHIAFKDKNGNSRIKRAYKLQSANSTSLTTYSTTQQINGLTYDKNNGDHGTHTSSTAGGSSVIVDGGTVTVTDDHANATYGGMAPEADLVIAGLSSLYTTSIGTAIQNICNYADQQGKPCVISLSLGSQNGPHDGTGSVAQIVNQYAGNNHIIVYAASNDAMRADYFVQARTSTGGGCYASATSTNNKTMLVNLQKAWTNADGNVQLYNPTFHAYARTPNTAISLKFRVVDTTTGNVVYSTNAYTISNTISMTGSTGLAQYFKSSSSYYNDYGDAGTIRIVRGQDNNNGKYYFTVYCPILVSTSYDDSDGDGVYNGKYALCVSVYPTNGSSVIDMWESSQLSWFGNSLQLSSTYANSYTIANGNDECSVSDNACYPKVISVGAYVSKNQITDYSGTTHDWSEDYPNIGDHAYFSSWQTAGYGPLGTALPTINAPGARIVAGVNHYHTASVDDYSYYGDDLKGDLVVNSNNYPYAAMEGTSMATPCVAGIVAQWLQACLEVDKTPSPDYIKEVMAATWDTDEWTNGSATGAHGAETFGTHGKINAIAGLQYILGVTGGPATLSVEPDELTFDAYTGQEADAKTFTVTGTGLKGDVTVRLNDDNNVFSVSAATITKSEAQNGKEITVTFNPSEAGNYAATITLSSESADDVTVALNATAGKGYQDVTVSGYGVSTLYLDFPVAIPYSTYDPDLLGVFIAYEMTGNEVKLARLRHNIPANTGVLVQGNAGTYRFPRIAEEDVVALTRENLLLGTTSPITPAEAIGTSSNSIVMVLGRGSNGYIGFYQFKGQTLEANKAYLIYNGSVGAKGLTFNADDGNSEATGISIMHHEECTMKNAPSAVYDLQGRKVADNPSSFISHPSSKPGVYIHEGKTIVIR